MSKLKAMTEQRAKEIWGSAASDLVGIERSELRSADEWIRHNTLVNLGRALSQCGHNSSALREYVLLMTRCHFGSMETDQFLQDMGCYPKWMKVSK